MINLHELICTNDTEFALFLIVLNKFNEDLKFLLESNLI